MLHATREQVTSSDQELRRQSRNSSMAPRIQTEGGNHAWILSFTGQMAATVAFTLAPRSVVMPSLSSIVVALVSLQQMDVFGSTSLDI